MIADDRQRALMLLDETARAIAQVVTIGEAKDVKDKIAAVEVYGRAQGWDEEQMAVLSAHRVRITARLGELLAGMEKAKAGRPPKIGDKAEPISKPPTLADLGITKRTSSEAQRLAAIPEATREARLARNVAKGRTTPVSSLLREEKAKAREQALAKQRATSKTVAAFVDEDAVVFCTGRERTADLLLTDPPYSTDVDDDFEEWIDGWLPVALATVRPTGRAFICCGAYPRELHAYLSYLLVPGPMVLEDVLVWTYRNVIGPAPSGFRLNWQAILHLAGPDAPPLDTPNLTDRFAVLDINAPDGRLGNRYHSWQKPDALAERLIRMSTKPGDVVLDPFCGTGTFALVAAQMGRQAFGCDIDDEALAIAERRGGRRA